MAFKLKYGGADFMIEGFYKDPILFRASMSLPWLQEQGQVARGPEVVWVFL